MSLKLPFIKDSKWPIMREPQERIANPSYDTQLQDHLMDEFMSAMDHKDAKRFREAIQALIYSIRNENSGEPDGIG